MADELDTFSSLSPQRALRQIEARLDALEAGSGGAGGFEEITTGVAPVVADPDVRFSVVTTGGTEGIEPVTLADPTDVDAPAIKTFLIKHTHANDFVNINVASLVGARFNPIQVHCNDRDPPSACLELMWNPALAAWQIMTGGRTITNEDDVLMNTGTLTGATLIEGVTVKGDTVEANGQFARDGETGISGSFIAESGQTITVVGGIITEISI